MLDPERVVASGLEFVDLDYEGALRLLYRTIDDLERGFMQRAGSWAATEPKIEASPSLRRFVDSALLEDGVFPGDSSMTGFRFMSSEEESDPYGQIAILSRYSRVPIPACYFSFDWHSEIAGRDDELRAIADDFYFCLRQLAPATAEALDKDRLRFGQPAA